MCVCVLAVKTRVKNIHKTPHQITSLPLSDTVHGALVPEMVEFKCQVIFQPYFLPLRIDLSTPLLGNTGLLVPIFTMLLNLIIPLCGSVVQPNMYSYGMLISHLVILSLCSGPRGSFVVCICQSRQFLTTPGHPRVYLCHPQAIVKGWNDTG